MATGTVFYAFSFRSPYSALADLQIDAIVERAGFALEPLPLVPPIPPEPEGMDAVVRRFKADYIVEDAARCADELGCAWNPPPPPVHFGAAQRSSAAWFYAREHEAERVFRNEIFRAQFGEGADAESDEVLHRCAQTAGLDPTATLAAADAETYRAMGPNALVEMGRRKVFGVPLFIAGEERFFGHDRLEMLARSLGGG